MLATKLIDKIPIASNLIWIKKSTKLLKRSKSNTQQPKTIQNTNIADIKSVIIEHPKIVHKSSKAVRQAEKVSQISAASKNSDNPL